VGSKNKLKRFKENEKFENVFQPSREEIVADLFPLKGKWNTDFLKQQSNNSRIRVWKRRIFCWLG